VKYILSALILIGVIIAFITICASIGFVIAKISDLEVRLDCSNIRYRKFKYKMTEHILPWLIGIILCIMIVVGLVIGYMGIFNWLK
jgi:hypothetical protein